MNGNDYVRDVKIVKFSNYRRCLSSDYTRQERYHKLDNKSSLNRPNIWTTPDILHGDLLTSQELIYDKCGFVCSQPHEEAQNAEYGAYVFTLNSLSIRFRVAKTTPTKIGQFVTLWQRSEDGSTQPYDVSDPADMYVIITRTGSHFGQFVFPKHVFLHRDIISDQGKGGKRAIRVYPPWDKPTSKQALKTQQWQLEYFLEVPDTEPVNIEHVQIFMATFKSKEKNLIIRNRILVGHEYEILN